MRKTTTQISCVWFIGLGRYKFKLKYYGLRFLNKSHFSIKTLVANESRDMVCFRWSIAKGAIQTHSIRASLVPT